MIKNRVTKVILTASIIITAAFSVWSYQERLETANYFIASEIIFMVMFSIICFLLYYRSKDRLPLLVGYILLITVTELSAANFKNIPFADIIFSFTAQVLFITNALLKVLLLIVLIRRFVKYNAVPKQNRAI
jgi:hypothetical protein